MADFDSILNAVIPWAVALIGVYILYKHLKEPLAPLFGAIDSFFIMIKGVITGENKEDPMLEQGTTLEYE